MNKMIVVCVVLICSSAILINYNKDVEAERINTNEDNRQKLISSCFQDEYSLYSRDWDNSCKTIYDDNEEVFEKCRTDSANAYFQSTGKTQVDVIQVNKINEFCRASWPLKSKNNCTLPGVKSEELNASFRYNKNICLQRYSK